MASTIYGEARVGKAGVSASDSKTIKVRETYTFRVVTDSKTTTRQEVLFGTPGLPLAGLVYSSNNLMCTSISADRLEAHPLYWDVVCEFESVHQGQKQDPANPNSPDPTTWIPVFEVDTTLTREAPVYEDINGNPIVNSAGQPFFPPLTKKIQLPSIPFTQYEDPSLTLFQILSRANKVNSVAFGPYPARTLLLELTGVQFGYYGGYAAWKVGYRCTYDPDTWDEKILNAGNKALDLGTGDLVDCVDDRGFPQMIGLLSVAGDQTTTANNLTFEIREKLDFSTFIRQ